MQRPFTSKPWKPLHPIHPRLGFRGHFLRWIHVHSILAALVAVLVLSATVFTAKTIYDRAHSPYAHFKLLQPRPPALAIGPAIPTHLTDPPTDSATITYKYLPRPGNQGDVGACQCFSFRKQLQYLLSRRAHQIPTRKSEWSCLFWYSEIGHGQDLGSDPTQYPPLISTKGGITPATDLDWVGRPKGLLPFPATPYIYDLAIKHRVAMSYTPLAGTQQPGRAAVINAEWKIYQGRPVNFGFPVYNGRNNLFGPGFLVDLPEQGDTLAGGHAVFFIAFYRTLCLPNAAGENVCGWFLASNSWGKGFGAGLDLKRHPGNVNGYFLVSYRFVEQQTWALGTFSVDKTQNVGALRDTPPPPWHQPGPDLTSSALIPPPTTPIKFKGLVGNWVYGVCAKDVLVARANRPCGHHADMGPTINAASHANGINAPGFVAVLAAECGLNTHSLTCDHVWGGADVSFGDCQVTLQTAGGFGVGNGVFDGYTGANTSYVRGFENNYKKCIWLGARVLGSYKRYLENRPLDRCPIDLPALYVAWNAGPGNSCTYLTNPTGQAGYNYFTNFLPWFRYATQFSRLRNPYRHA